MNALLYILGLLVAGVVGLFVGMKLRGPVTKRDLWMSEVRIIQAIGVISPATQRSARALQQALDRLDAQVTDKITQ